MESPQTTIGIVQIGEVVWERRPSKQFHLVDGALRSKPMPSNSMAASLAYLPHSAGVLQAYAKKYASNPRSFKFLTPLYKRLPLAEAVEHFNEADVVGLSVYVWNVGFSLALARELKERRPEVLIIMGGPQVPDNAEAFLRSYPFVDIVCHGEGERTFLEILERLQVRSWEGIESTSYIDNDGRFRAAARRRRITDLDDIPSPMLEGTYEDLMRSIPDQQWLATWETNRGCPFACTFCDWGSATASKVSRYSEDRLFREIEWLADHRIQHLFVCDANFGMLPRDIEIARRLAKTYEQHGRYIAISVQNTKNRTDRSESIQRIFQQSRVVTFGSSISLQSVDPTVLRVIKRENISLEAFDRLQKHYAEQGLETYSDLILGLPGETYQSFTDGVGSVIRKGQLNRVAFYECSVLPNAPMAQPEYRQTFNIETVPVKLVHAHEPLDRNHDGEPESIDIVVSTSSMSREDWVRARVFAYFVELLFYDRILHVPLLVMGAASGFDYKHAFEAFMEADAIKFPLAASIHQTFEAHVRSMLGGGPQYVPSVEWLNIWWPPDQYALIGLAQSESLERFYEEARLILRQYVRDADLNIDPILIDETVRLNQAMFALPFQLCDEVLETTYPVGQDYLEVLAGGRPSFARRASACNVERTTTIWMSWTDWCEDLVRRVFLRKYYLYPIHILDDSNSSPVSVNGSEQSRATSLSLRTA
jgi:radical SAM superfamily enzyme YgiQ (UPF0313 family)